MKLRAIALNALGLFVRDRLLIVVGAIFLCVILLMMTPLLTLRAKTTVSNMQNMQAYVLDVISGIMYMVSGAGSLLAAWAAADAVPSEMKTGTILAVMARPVKRWQFLLGKYLGVMLLMSCYVVAMTGLSFVLAWIAGQKVQAPLLLLILYPLIRYSVYAAIAMFIATVAHPVLTWAATLVLALGATMLAPTEGDKPPADLVFRWLKAAGYYLLPSTNFLSEDRFLAVRRASLRQAVWTEHALTLLYGLDYALVFLLLAMWSFYYRSLKRD